MNTVITTTTAGQLKPGDILVLGVDQDIRMEVTGTSRAAASSAHRLAIFAKDAVTGRRMRGAYYRDLGERVTIEVADRCDHRRPGDDDLAVGPCPACGAA